MTDCILITRGAEGWGTVLTIPIDANKSVISVTGTGIHPLAQAIADKAGVKARDAFKDPVSDDEVLCAVINCAGTLRCGVYPQKGIPTININPIGPSGPLAYKMNESNYISGVTEHDLELITADESLDAGAVGLAGDGVLSTSDRARTERSESDVTPERPSADQGGVPFALHVIQTVGTAAGKFTSIFYQSGKEAIDICLRTVLPFMAFISVVVGIISYTGIGSMIAKILTPLAGNIFGLVLMSIICGLPFLSPILGAGAAVAQVVGVLIGAEIGKGAIPVQYALPAIFAIDIQVGADFVPVGLSMQEATPETVKYGVPAFLISRCVTGPVCVLVAWLFSFGMY